MRRDKLQSAVKCGIIDEGEGGVEEDRRTKTQIIAKQQFIIEWNRTNKYIYLILPLDINYHYS